jgi:hypothetical protein
MEEYMFIQTINGELFWGDKIKKVPAKEETEKLVGKPTGTVVLYNGQARQRIPIPLINKQFILYVNKEYEGEVL